MTAGKRVAIIGGGPGGYVAAIRAAQLGFNVSLIEKATLGGICLNWGCIPTKAFLRSAEILRLVRDAPAFGLQVSNVEFSLPEIVGRARRISARLASGVTHLLKKAGVEVIIGRATLAGNGRIRVDGSAPRELEAAHIVVATGARPRTIPGLTPDNDRIWTYFDALDPPHLPRELVVIGSGAIGIEFACFYRALGSSVTVIEMLDSILPAEDRDVSRLARRCMEKDGIRFCSSARFSALENSGDPAKPMRMQISIDGNEGSERLGCDTVLSSVGVRGNVEDLGLEALGVDTESGCIRVNHVGATGVEGLYAIGDVTGAPMLAHAAEHEGVRCVEAIAGRVSTPPDPMHIPRCTYGFPQIASVGMTESMANAANIPVRIGRFPFQANGKALALGEAEGFVKTIWRADTGQLLGAHLIGPEVTELIQGFVCAMGLETTETELMHTVFPHPTLSEAMHESTLAAFGRAIHM